MKTFIAQPNKNCTNFRELEFTTFLSRCACFSHAENSVDINYYISNNTWKTCKDSAIWSWSKWKISRFFSSSAIRKNYNIALSSFYFPSSLQGFTLLKLYFELCRIFLQGRIVKAFSLWFKISTLRRLKENCLQSHHVGN